MKSLEERHQEQLKQCESPSNYFKCIHCGAHVYAVRCVCDPEAIRKGKEYAARMKARMQ